jgi:hypothetical protein
MSIKNQNKQYYHGGEGLSSEDKNPNLFSEKEGLGNEVLPEYHNGQLQIPVDQKGFDEIKAARIAVLEENESDYESNIRKIFDNALLTDYNETKYNLDNIYYKDPEIDMSDNEALNPLKLSDAALQFNTYEDFLKADKESQNSDDLSKKAIDASLKNEIEKNPPTFTFETSPEDMYD